VFGVAKPSTSPDSRRIHSPSLPPHIAPSKAALARKPIAFIENKNPQQCRSPPLGKHISYKD
jgi:hypothetical protein